MYISEDNRISNEDDFKKALDLLEYINEVAGTGLVRREGRASKVCRDWLKDVCLFPWQEEAVDIETLKREIFARALKKDE